MVACRPFGSLSNVVMSKKLMPGFGKSGTSRIICLRSMVNMKSLSNAKALFCSRWIFVGDDDALDARARRPLANGALDARDRVLLAFDEGLDAAIEQIRHPAADPFARGGVVHEISKADALHTPADHKSARHTHSESSGSLFHQLSSRRSVNISRAAADRASALLNSLRRAAELAP